ncbi:MAG: DUF421 domain-containing protein [Clostridia bacterium]|nr:DUF421 domain-containing protein [Clostridia bacterium]
MATVFIRTIIVYFVFIVAIRLLGKRQVGELELSELVITFMLSELATAPIFDPSIPLTYILIPLVILISSEIISSFLVTKSSFMKKILIGNPSYIIRKGKLNEKELSKLRMSLPELLGELRLKDIGDISEVDYAVLEENGKLSVLKKQDNFSHAIILDGKINQSSLEISGVKKKWILDYLKSQNRTLDEVFLLTYSDNGDINIILKEEK